MLDEKVSESVTIYLGVRQRPVLDERVSNPSLTRHNAFGTKVYCDNKEV